MLSKCCRGSRGKKAPDSPRGDVATRDACAPGYPMYCVPLIVALEMKSVKRHEVLLAEGVLVKHNFYDTVPVIFLSHEWVSTEHADPNAAQFAVFQGAVRQLLAGYEVRSDWVHSYIGLKDEVCDSWPVLLQNALVWYDYFSVPQETSNSKNAQLAIRSIPAYIEMSTIPFILAPTVEHSEFVNAKKEPRLCNYYSWQRRGWCRMELIAMLLKGFVRSPVVILSERCMHFASASSLRYQLRVAEGTFACCTRNHQRIHSDGTASSLSCDKPPLYDVLQVMISRRLRYERELGNLRNVRQLLAFTHIWLRGLRDVEDNYHADDNTLVTFLEKYLFTTPHEFDGGCTPLRFACISGNVNIARQLLEEKADLEANLKKSGHDSLLFAEKGFSILCHTIRLCCCSEHEDILNLLVSHKANLHSPKHMDVLAAASCSPSLSKRGARWFLRTFPDWDVNRKSVGKDAVGSSRWPLYCSLYASADLDYVRLLCEHNADFGLQAWPMSDTAFTMACSLCPTASPDIAEYILHKIRQRLGEDGANGATSINIQLIRDEVNRRTGMNAPCWIRACLKAKRAMNIGPADARNVFLRFMGATPLLIAASEGKDRVCKWLLDEKADPSIANMDGKTPLSLAQELGFQRVIDVLSVAYVRRIENVR
eukprot:GEMP01012475.1.p1 GENE.GEMP01012475.1~~GEMP01012475.1.p1  ORF type:complete len:652 (+),score=96.99 GEMP01012475.1:85-2040(+)